jgi:2-methylcitrate dehydratase PrpD
MKNGRRISSRADFANGSPAIPMTEDEVANKFRECAEFAGFEKQRSDRIINLVLNLELVKNISELTGLLRAC